MRLALHLAEKKRLISSEEVIKLQSIAGVYSNLWRNISDTFMEMHNTKHFQWHQMSATRKEKKTRLINYLQIHRTNNSFIFFPLIFMVSIYDSMIVGVEIIDSMFPTVNDQVLLLYLL